MFEAVITEAGGGALHSNEFYKINKTTNNILEKMRKRRVMKLNATSVDTQETKLAL